MTRAEFLIATLRPDFRDEDLAEVMRWNTGYHRTCGVVGVRYFVSEDRRSFVMWVPHDENLGDRLAEEWRASATEDQGWFQSMMTKVFESGRGSMYREVTPP